MGTRGAFGFYIDGVTKVTYNHFDSNPGSLGHDIVQFVREMVRGRDEDPVTLLAKVRALKPIPDREPTPEEIERLKPWTNLRVSNQSVKDWYCLLREAQGDIAAVLETGFYSDSEEFLSNSLMCEYAYVINFDDEVIEFYRGFQEEPHDKGRYADKVIEREPPRTTYYPVALIKTFPLTGIPEDWLEQVDPSEEDED